MNTTDQQIDESILAIINDSQSSQEDAPIVIEVEQQSAGQFRNQFQCDTIDLNTFAQSQEAAPSDLPQENEQESREDSKSPLRQDLEMNSKQPSLTDDVSHQNFSQTPMQKNCKLHIGNLATDIAEDTLRKAFSKFGAIREVKVIRKNSQGQPLKEYCYGFVLMVESTSATIAVNEMKDNIQSWTVAFSKDKVSESDQVSRKGSSPSHKKEKIDQPKKKEEVKDKDKVKKSKDKEKEKEKEKEEEKKKEKEKEKQKEKQKEKEREKEKEKEKEKKKDKKKKSKSRSKSRSRSHNKPTKKRGKPFQGGRRRSSVSSSSSDFVPKHSVLVPVQQHGLPGLENPDKLMNMLFMQPDELQQIINKPVLHCIVMLRQQSQPQNPVLAPIHVRELFISGIPQSKTSDDLKRIMSLFGIIEKVDIFPKQLVLYAYVKYKRLESAYKAYEQSATIAQLLESLGQVKVYFSDPFRRNQIVGNADDSEKEEELLPVLFVGYPSNPNFTVDEVLLRKLAEKYGGHVKTLEHRKSEPQLRTFVLIEFFSVSQARKAKKRFLRVKVQSLGDKKCDVAMLSNLPPSMAQSQYRQGVGQIPNLHQRQPYQQNIPQQGMSSMYRPQHQQQQLPYSNPQQQFYPPQSTLPQQQQFRQQQSDQQHTGFPTQQAQGKQTTPSHIVPSNGLPQQQQQYYQNPLQQQVAQLPQQFNYQAQPQALQSAFPPQTPHPGSLDTAQQYQYSQQQQYYPPFQQQQQQQQQPPAYGSATQSQFQRIIPGQNLSPSNQTPSQLAARPPQGQQFYNYQNSQQQQQYPPQAQLPQPINNAYPQPQQNNQFQGRMPPVQGGSGIGQNESMQMVLQNFVHDEQLQKPQQDAMRQQPIRNEDSVVWSGFMMRGKQNRLGIDARILSSPDPRKVNLPYHLNVNFKASIADAVNKASSPMATVLIVTPSDETQFRQFEEYVAYFTEKNRAGVIQLGDEIVIYIVPPGTREGTRLYKASEKEMIAIYWPK